MKGRKGLVSAVFLALGALGILVFPAAAQTVTATAPTMDLTTSLQYMFGFFNSLGPVFWALFGLALVPFFLGLIRSIKPGR